MITSFSSRDDAANSSVHGVELTLGEHVLIADASERAGEAVNRAWGSTSRRLAGRTSDMPSRRRPV